mgnify:CR=1 FL=1
MSFFDCSNCLTIRFTSAISTPAPFAILCFLDGFRSDGFARSSFVIERMIASTLSMDFSSISTFPFIWAIPGIMFRMLFIPPIFLI